MASRVEHQAAPPAPEAWPTVRLRRLLEIAAAINARLTLDDTLQLIAQASLELAGSQRAVIWQVNEEDGGFERPVTAVATPSFAWHPQRPRPDGVSTRTVREARRIVVASGEGSDVPLRVDDARLGIRHVVGVPLRAGDAVIGVLAAGTTRAEGYQNEHLAALDIMADQAAIALQNARLYEEAQHRAASLQSLAEAAAALQSDLEPRAILKQLCQGLARLGMSCLAGRLTPEGDAFVIEHYVANGDLMAALERIAGQPTLGLRLPASAAPAALGLLAGEACFATDLVAAGAALFPPPGQEHARALLARLGLDRAIVAPLTGKRGALGGVLAFGPRVREEDVPLVATFARQAALALENATLVAALGESEGRYRAIVEHSPAGICIHDGQRVLFVSPRLAEMLGQPAAALTAMEDLLSRMPATDRQAMRDIMRRRLSGREAPNRYEVRMELPDGQLHDLELRAARLTFAGRPASLVMVLDITEIKQAREAVLRERQRLYRILNNMLDPVLVIDGRYTVRFMNKAAQDRFGDQVGGICYQAVMERAGACRPCSLDAVLGDEQEGFRSEMGGPDGSWWEIAATPIQLEDAQGVVAVMRDVTDRKRAVEALRASELERRIFMESAADLMCTLDEEGHLRYLNRAACEALGDTAESLRRRRIGEFVTPAEAALLNEAEQQLIENGQVFLPEVNIRRADGTLVPCEVSAVGIFGADGGYQGCHVVARNVAEHKRLRQELMLSHRLAAVGELSAGIAHEFNNLTAAMSILAELALQTGHPDIIRRALHNVVECCEQGGQITRNLLAFARPSPPDKRPVSLRRCLERALGLADMEVRSAGVQVVLNCPADLAPIMADARQIEEACLNLILNACHAMPHGGRLTISAAPGPTRPSNGSGDVSVEFRDTGIGIPAENLDRVFDPFFTTKGALGEAGLTGLGLGLSIAHSIVTAHGGMLGAESREGEGSTFTMWLPLSPAPLEEAAPAAPDGPTEQLPPLRILVADDEPAVREGLAELLRVQGHTVVEVADGQQALEALSRNDIDLALVDLLMPTLNGRDLLDAFDGSPPCPVVVITGRGAETDADALVARGASSLLIKPFQIRALNAALEQAYYAR